jgi:hypothetical protein
MSSAIWPVAKVVAGTAVDQVAAALAPDTVVAAEAGDDVVAGQPGDDVPAGGAAQDVAAVGAHDGGLQLVDLVRRRERGQVQAGDGLLGGGAGRGDQAQHQRGRAEDGDPAQSPAHAAPSLPVIGGGLANRAQPAGQERECAREGSGHWVVAQPSQPDEER